MMLRKKAKCEINPVGKMKQTGQAMPEFIVFALFVMVPVFLAIPVLGKIADMNQKTVLASRYGAWERTIATPTAKPEATITNEARLRFFARNNKYIQTGEAVKEKNKERSRLWRSISKNYDPMLTKFSGVNSATSTVPGATGMKGVKLGFQVADTALNLRPNRALTLAKDFDETYDIYRSNMSLPVATYSKIDSLKKGIDCANKKSNKVLLCVKRHNAIYTDTWNAGSRDMVKTRVQHNLYTASTISDVFESAFKKALGIILIFPEVKSLDLGIVEPDVLAADRLGNNITYKSK